MSDPLRIQTVGADEARRARDSRNQSGPPPVILPCQRCWIEVELLDEDDKGVPREPYWIKLPDGAIREGLLDDNGFVRLDNIPCGTCIVRFPGTDEHEFQAKTVLPAEKTEWIEIELLDDAGQPLAGEVFSVDLPDGRNQQGTLDKQGRARIDGIPRGVCVVRFPDIDAADFVER